MPGFREDYVIIRFPSSEHYVILLCQIFQMQDKYFALKCRSSMWYGGGKWIMDLTDTHETKSHCIIEAREMERID